MVMLQHYKQLPVDSCQLSEVPLIPKNPDSPHKGSTFAKRKGRVFDQIASVSLLTRQIPASLIPIVYCSL